jgi:hypothetical protein
VFSIVLIIETSYIAYYVDRLHWTLLMF